MTAMADYLLWSKMEFTSRKGSRIQKGHLPPERASLDQKGMIGPKCNSIPARVSQPERASSPEREFVIPKIILSLKVILGPKGNYWTKRAFLAQKGILYLKGYLWLKRAFIEHHLDDVL